MNKQTDRFENFPPHQDMPAVDAFEIVPQDDAQLKEVTRALYIGVGGDITVTTARGSKVSFTGLPTGSILPIRASVVWSAGTTAAKVVGLV